MARKTLDIEQAFFLRAPVPRVFQALADPPELTKWFLASARLPPRVGQEYEFVWRGGFRHTGKVLAYQRNKKLSLSWPNRYRKATRWTTVTFTLTKQGEGTLLRLKHTGYPRSGPWIEIYGDTQSGWAYFLMNLRSVLEHGHDLRSPKDG